MWISVKNSIEMVASTPCKIINVKSKMLPCILPELEPEVTLFLFGNRLLQAKPFYTICDRLSSTAKFADIKVRSVNKSNEGVTVK